MRREEDANVEDGRELTAEEVHNYLTRVMYNRRNKGNPLWNSIVVAGVEDGVACVLLALHLRFCSPPHALFHCLRRTLGTVDHIGTAYTEDFIVTGFGGHMAIPLIRESWKPDMSESDARALVEECMKILYYRDCRTINKITLAKITAEGGMVSEPFTLATKWDFQSFIKAKAGADTGGSW